MNSKIAVIIPCYNESMTIEKVITDYKKLYRKLQFMFTIITQPIIQMKLPEMPAPSSGMNTGRAKAM